MSQTQRQPGVSHARKNVPARKGMRRSPHVPADPVGRGAAKGGVGWGGLLVGGAGCLFVAYVWNVGGLHVTLDNLFGGWNDSLRGHDELVAKWYLAALPVLGMAFAVLMVWWMLAGAAGKVKRAHKRRKKRLAMPAPVQPVGVVAGGQAPAMAMEFVRPVRLAGARDESILVRTDVVRTGLVRTEG